jgi:rare lipoprotein A
MRSATFGAAILIAASFAGIQSANAGSVSVASFSAGGEKLNRHRANGKVFKPGALTAAHQSLPIGSKVIVTNVHSGRSVVVRVNDRDRLPGLDALSIFPAAPFSASPASHLA